MSITPPLFPEHSGATFSKCRKYRYKLWRQWNPDLPTVCFVLMNPSTADEVDDDPTVAGCQVRLSHWSEQYGGVVVVNVFAWRETNSELLPSLIGEGVDIVGDDNDAAIVEAAKQSALVVCGWGNPGNLLGRGDQVLELLRSNQIDAFAFAKNKNGSPKHPLYVAHATQPRPIASL
ncbi:MAG: DUF1643 domain-containing protein [Betaproteobacteria bacterium]|jgi:hypothetical protein|nr:DUF1643 domain-containing protein [Betaproteobacteria bacterium]